MAINSFKTTQPRTLAQPGDGAVVRMPKHVVGQPVADEFLLTRMSDIWCGHGSTTDRSGPLVFYIRTIDKSRRESVPLYPEGDGHHELHQNL
jgi:hypothetical protein